MRRPCVAVAVLSLLVPRAARPQGQPFGPEFRINTYTTSSQILPAVATDASGHFVVVWNSNGQDGSFGGVFGQRYAGSGAPLGPEFRVNIYSLTSAPSPGHRRVASKR